MMMGILKVLNRILNLRDLFWFCFARIIVQPQLWAQRLSVYSIVWAGAGNTQPMVAKKSVSSIVQWLVFHYSGSMSICLLADTQQVEELHTIHRFSQSWRRPLLGPTPG